jgi:hypothetical protein
MSDKKRTYTRTMKVWTVMDAEGNERLVRAYTSADVLRHVTPQFVITPATHDDIISLMAAGVMVEPSACPKPSRPTKPAGLTD